VETAFEEIADNNRTAQRAELILSDCPSAAQEVFRLRVYGEYGFAEIARMTGRPEASVKTTYYRTAARIRKELEGDPERGTGEQKDGNRKDDS
jgi:DNA-directed RNA polymerase specialized sigma24 family protein